MTGSCIDLIILGWDRAGDLLGTAHAALTATVAAGTDGSTLDDEPAGAPNRRAGSNRS
jgi:hypothetical protein